MAFENYGQSFLATKQQGTPAITQFLKLEGAFKDAQRIMRYKELESSRDRMNKVDIAALNKGVITPNVASQLATSAGQGGVQSLTGEQIPVENGVMNFPESMGDKKTRLQVEALERQAYESTPEGASKKSEREAEDKRIVGGGAEKIEMKKVSGMLDTVWSEADSLIPAQENTQKAAGKGISRTFKRSTVARLTGFSGQEGQNARAFADFSEGTLSLLIRSLGEKGVLTGPDVDRARKLSPGEGDTAFERKRKKQSMLKFLNSRIKSYYEKNEETSESSGKTSSGIGYELIED